MEKRSLTLTCLIWLLCSAIFAQWQWQNPYPQGNDLHDVQVSDEAIAWAVGDSGTILHTTNQGSSWEILESGTNEHLFRISSPDQNTAWAVGSNGTIMNTTNGGLTWLQQTSGTDFDLVDISFVNENKGWIIGKSVTYGELKSMILFTTNAGNIWTVQLYDTTFTLSSLHFIDELNGWAIGNCYDEIILLKTNDGGSTWIKMQSILPPDYAKDNYFPNPQHGWIITESKIIHTGNSGLTWEIQQDVFLWGIHFEKAFFSDSLHGWVSGWQQYEGAGRQPLVFNTTDGGLSWHQHYLFNPDNNLNKGYSWCKGISFHDNLNGFVVGSKGIIMHSLDGGNQWESQSGINTFLTLNDIYFVDSFNGWTTGYQYGLPFTSIVMNTVDGGVSWSEQSFGGELFLPESIFFPDINHGWSVGRGGYPFEGRILRTVDGGVNWEVQFNLLYNQLYDIFFTDINYGWAVGYGGYVIHPNILHTNDGGNTWVTQDAGTEIRLNGVFFTDPLSGWVVGKDGTILNTIDGGINWTARLSGTTSDLNRVMFIDNNNGWTVGGEISPISGIILHTSDAGVTWETQLSSTNFMLIDLSFTDTVNGWAVGWKNQVGGIVLHTNDGGLTWQEQQTGTNRGFTSVFFTNPEKGWIAGEYGSILHTENGGMVGVKEVPGPAQSSKLRFQFFPNPAYDIITISLPVITSNNRLSIFTINGKKVLEMLLTRTKTQIDISALHRGVYFVWVQDEKGVQVVKFVKQ